jgi:hypothetical protein
LPAIRLGTCLKCSIRVTITTLWALSNGAIRFFIPQTIPIESSKNRFLTLEIEVKVPTIRLGTREKGSTHVPSTTRWALSHGAIKVFTPQTIPIERCKNRFLTIEIEVKVTAIRLGTCYKCSTHVPGTTRWTLSHGAIRVFTPQTISIERCKNPF